MFWVQPSNQEVPSLFHLQLQVSELSSSHWEILELHAWTVLLLKLSFQGAISCNSCDYKRSPVSEVAYQSEFSFFLSPELLFFFLFLSQFFWIRLFSVPKESWFDVSNKYMKRCSTLLVIREAKITITKRHHCIPVRMAIIKKTVTSVGKDVKKLES